MKINIVKEPSAVKDEDTLDVHPEEIETVEDASCTHVSLFHTLDYYRNRVELFGEILGKVRYGGIISLEGIDIGAISRNIVNGRYTNDQVNKILYNDNHSISDMKEMKDLLLTQGFTINKARYDGNSYFIEAERPTSHE